MRVDLWLWQGPFSTVYHAVHSHIVNSTTFVTFNQQSVPHIVVEMAHVSSVKQYQAALRTASAKLMEFVMFLKMEHALTVRFRELYRLLLQSVWQLAECVLLFMMIPAVEAANLLLNYVFDRVGYTNNYTGIHVCLFVKTPEISL